jgi:hypothetical protein
VGHKAHSMVPSKDTEDPSNLGGRSMASSLILAPLVKRIVDRTSEIFKAKI